MGPNMPSPKSLRYTGPIISSSQWWDGKGPTGGYARFPQHISSVQHQLNMVGKQLSVHVQDLEKELNPRAFIKSDSGCSSVGVIHLRKNQHGRPIQSCGSTNRTRHVFSPGKWGNGVGDYSGQEDGRGGGGLSLSYFKYYKVKDRNYVAGIDLWSPDRHLKPVF